MTYKCKKPVCYFCFGKSNQNHLSSAELDIISFLINGVAETVFIRLRLVSHSSR